MSELQVNTIRPVSGTTLTVTNDTNLTVSGSGKVTTPLVEAADLDINGTSSLELKFNNSTKLAVTNTGATVTGTMTATTFSGDGSGLTGITSAGTGGTSSTGNLQLISNSGGANGARDIVFLDQNSEKARLYGATGDFAVDTDTLYVKASNDRVGIGTTSPTSTLDVDGTCTATAFVGPITGNVTGDLTGAVLTPAQTNVTSLGTLTSLAVNGNTSLAGNLSMNAGYGSVAPVFGCRAWINFDGTTFAITTTWQGGTCTATRAAGNSTCTITTSSPHGLLIGHAVTPTTTVLDSTIKTYGVTSTTTNTFTITTNATSALSSASVAFSWQGIRASGNIHSVSRVGQGDYYLNFGTSMPDSNYCLVSTGSDTSGDSTFRSTNSGPYTAQGSTFCRVFHKAVNSNNQQFEDTYWICAAIFR